MKRPTQQQFTIVNIATIVSSLSLIFFFVYYLTRISLIKELQIREYEISPQTEEDNEESNENDAIKFNMLYTEILKYFSEKEPFRNPDFSISQLAIGLNTNVKYIAKAIKINSDTNFNVFINTYRINKIKDMLNNDYQNRYTMQYIYTFAGFRNQSTFNKAFKLVEGITPSEYVRDLHKNTGQ